MLTALLLVVAQAPPPPVAVPHGALVVHIVDPEGGLVLEDFVVHATPHRQTPTYGRRAPGNRVFDREDGTATFQRLPAGRYTVEALHRTGDAAQPTEIEVRANESVSCELRLATPPPSRCLYVIVDQPEDVKGLQLVARAASGESFPMALAEGALNRYVARGVPLSRYTVSVVDPRYRMTSIGEVLPGAVAQLALSGSASLALSFRAVPGDASLRPQALELPLTTSTRLRWPIPKDGPPVVLEDILPGDLLAIAHFAERAPVLIHVADVRHGEDRELEVTVPLGQTLTGRVVDAAGEAVADVVVCTYTTIREGTAEREWWCLSLEPGSRDKSKQPNFEHTNERATLRVARTDSAGRYTFIGVATGPHVVRAFGTPFTRREVETLIGAEDDPHTAPDIVLVGSAGADVDVQLPAHIDPKELEFMFQFGASSWLRPIDVELLPIPDARRRIVLRGLPEARCTLLVSHRIANPGGTDENHPLGRVTFLPKSGSPTAVLWDAR